MYTNIQQYFRYYLALMLSVLLAVGVRLQAAPLGTRVAATFEVTATKTVGSQAGSAPGAVATR